MIRILLLAGAVLLLPSAALAGGGGGGICAGFAEGDTVRLLDSCLDGTAHFAEPGVVTVRNDGDSPHDYTALDGTFETGLLQPGASADITVDEPGVHRVRCTLHSSPDGDGMAGVLVVGDRADMTLAATAVDVAAEPGEAGGQWVAWAALALAAAALAVSAAQRRRAARNASASTS